MTESRLAAILAEDTPPFWRRPTAPKRRRRRPLLTLFRRSTLRLFFLLPVFGLAWWTLTANEFAVDEIKIAGAERVEGSWIEERLVPARGRNLVSLRIKNVRDALLGHPWIDKVDVRKDLPSRLIIEISEHQPGALLVCGEQGFLVTQGGLVFSRVDPGDDLELLRIIDQDEEIIQSVGSEGSLIGQTPPVVGAALAVVSDLQGIVQAWMSGLQEVRVLGLDEFELRFDRAPGSILVDSKSAREKALLLNGLLPQIVEMYSVDSFDLRFGNRIVLRGATELGSSAAQDLERAKRREGA